jgi:hypothetical protein
MPRAQASPVGLGIRVPDVHPTPQDIQLDWGETVLTWTTIPSGRWPGQRLAGPRDQRHVIAGHDERRRRPIHVQVGAGHLCTVNRRTAKCAPLGEDRLALEAVSRGVRVDHRGDGEETPK